MSGFVLFTCDDSPVPGIFRTQITLIFVDPDNRELARVSDASIVPRAGENVRVKNVPYVVERVGYDVPANDIERIFVVCQPA